MQLCLSTKQSQQLCPVHSLYATTIPKKGERINALINSKTINQIYMNMFIN